jgi:hypothetical protein
VLVYRGRRVVPRDAPRTHRASLPRHAIERAKALLLPGFCGRTGA